MRDLVPEGWTERRLDEASVVIDCKHRTPSYVPDGIPVISPGNISWGPLSSDSPRKVTPEEYEQLMDHCSVELGDIVFSRNQSAGIGAYVANEEPFVLGQDTVLIKPKDYDARYLYLCMQSDLFRRQMFKLSGGSTFSRINLRELKRFKVRGPTRSEQQKIARILSTWDKAIATVEKLIENSKAQKKALMQQLLTGKRRFPQFRERRWRSLKANDVFLTSSIRKNVEGELLAVTQDFGVVPRSILDRKVVMPEGSTESYKLVEPGDFVISLRSFQGGIEYSSYRGLVSPAYHVLKPKLPIVDSFYKHYFKSHDFIGHLAVAVIGIRDGKQVSYSEFSFLQIPYPELDEQRHIAITLDAIDKELTNYWKQLDTIKNQKKALMQQLLTGKRRVKVDAS